MDEDRIKKLEFDRKYNLAFESVFGNTIICQSLEVAGAYTRSHSLNSITLDGDKYDRKGSLTGGYHDVRRSRLDAVKNLKVWQDRYEDESNQLSEVKTTMLRLDQQISQLIGKLQVLDGKRRKVAEEREPLVASAMSTQKEAEALRTRVARLEAHLVDQQSAIRNMKREVEAYQDELKTKMQETLSGSEQARLLTLTNEIAKTKKEMIELSRDRSEVSDDPPMTAPPSILLTSSAASLPLAKKSWIVN